MDSMTIHFSRPGTTRFAESDDTTNESRIDSEPDTQQDPLEELWQAYESLRVATLNLESEVVRSSKATQAALERIAKRVEKHDLWFEQLVWGKDGKRKTP